MVTALKADGKDDQAKEFQANAAAGLKAVLGNWKNWDAYVGESEEAHTGMWVLVDYREDGTTPYAIIWKHALKEMKV